MGNLEGVAAKVATRLGAHGAHAVALVGSVARGDSHSASDVDLVAIGEGPAYQLEIVDDVLVSISWKTTARVREQFDTPLDAGGAVPSWRGARLLHDPNGVGASLQHAAHAWDWSRISTQCDRVVARELTGYAEEVFRLVGLRARGDLVGAAVMRVVLATRLPFLMAVHHRLLYDSENALWPMVSSVMGSDWERDYAIALGVERGAADFAALALYRSAASRAERVLGHRERPVVEAAVAMSERVS